MEGDTNDACAPCPPLLHFGSGLTKCKPALVSGAVVVRARRGVRGRGRGGEQAATTLTGRLRLFSTSGGNSRSARGLSGHARTSDEVGGEGANDGGEDEVWVEVEERGDDASAPYPGLLRLVSGLRGRAGLLSPARSSYEGGGKRATRAARATEGRTRSVTRWREAATTPVRRLRVLSTSFRGSVATRGC